MQFGDILLEASAPSAARSCALCAGCASHGSQTPRNKETAGLQQQSHGSAAAVEEGGPQGQGWARNPN